MKKIIAKKLWQSSKGLHPGVESFTVRDDYLVDRQLLPYDIRASVAHAEMLNKIKILSKKALRKIKKGLEEILREYRKGKFSITPEQEDIHTAIEQFLTKKCGRAGKLIHTGRSRNDQSLVMIRLFARENLEQIEKSLKKLYGFFKKKIVQTKSIPMPGYTHMQKAMPTTVATWLDSYLSALKNLLPFIKAARKLIDQNPLGSASGFGIGNFPLDRKFTARKLGFGKVQKNPMYCAFSRGYFESIVLQVLSQPIIIFGRFANDMLMFTTQEFNFFSLPDNFTTGSSIMPQKKNYDVFEIMRGNTKVFHSCQSQIQEIISSLGSGYHRDLQLTKKPFIAGVNLCRDTVDMMIAVVPVLRVNKSNLEKAMTPELFLTEEVYKLVKKGTPFRDAYMEIKKKWKK